MTTIPLTQTEEIVWHKYPEEKPPDNDFRRYLLEIASVCFHNGIMRFSTHEFICATYYPKGTTINNQDPGWELAATENRVVRAWAELPKGWAE